MSYVSDREFADRMIPQLKQIIGFHILDVGTLEQDQSEATDLIVLRARDMRVAARVRRFGYAERYRFEFTLRSRRDSGVKTELSKVVDGWGDWLFYGHCDASERTIAIWWLIDLAHFRAHLSRDAYRARRRLRWGERSNGDGTYFSWFDLRSFPPDPPILVAASAALPVDGLPPIGAPENHERGGNGQWATRPGRLIS